MQVWSVNTNQSNTGDEFANWFLEQNRVILWERDGKSNLSEIRKGDLILVYHNQKRVIGVGFAISEREIVDSREETLNVDWIFKNLDNPIKLDNIESKKIGMFHGAIFNWTENIDTFKLLTEIGKRV